MSAPTQTPRRAKPSSTGTHADGPVDDGVSPLADHVEFGRSAVHDPRLTEAGSVDAGAPAVCAAEPRRDGIGAVVGVDWPVLAWILGEIG